LEPADEHKLAAAAIRGDLEAFGKLCGDYYPTLTATAYAVVRDHQLAQDAVQEAFARALVKLPGLKRPEKFAPWLAVICRNHARDVARKHARSVPTEDLTDVPDRSESVNRDSQQRDQVVRKLLDRLPSSDRQVIVLRYYNNLSYEHMSAVLGLTPAAINARLYRAKTKLARMLQREGITGIEL
jgi:RNA polymerase sigma-70 factor, ECF subfamily